MVDSHCHLDFPDYQEDFAAVLERTRGAVEFVVNVGTDVRSSERAADISEAYPFIYAAVGVHPHDAVTLTAPAADRLRTLVQADRVVAVGECGLDYARLTPGHEEQERTAQREAFRTQIELARETRLPLVIHCREAYGDLLEMLGELQNTSNELRGVIHCYLDDAATAHKLLDLGFYISFTGIITFKNASPQVLEAVRQVPLERLMVETDAPFLAPAPYRGKRNEPAYVWEVAKRVAELKGVGLSEVDQVTSRNARQLFGIA